MTAERVYLAATVSTAFFREQIARFLHSITAQFEATEVLLPRHRYLASHRADRNDAAALLLEGETLIYDDEDGTGYYAARTVPRWQHNDEERRTHERLRLACSLLQEIKLQIERSISWQEAQRWQDDHTAPLDYVTHVGELRAVLDVLSALKVDPHREE